MLPSLTICYKIFHLFQVHGKILLYYKRIYDILKQYFKYGYSYDIIPDSVGNDNILGMEHRYERLLSYMKDYRKESILGPLFKMLEASFELLVPLVVASMVDVGIRNRDGGYIMKMGGLLLLLALVGLACSLTAQYFAAKAATGAEQPSGMTCISTSGPCPMQR